MYKFVLRVRIGVSFQDLPFMAESVHLAIQQAEAQFGSGSYMGCITEEWVG
jgi:hypothetical protein